MDQEKIDNVKKEILNGYKIALDSIENACTKYCDENMTRHVPLAYLKLVTSSFYKALEKAANNPADEAHDDLGAR